MGLLQKFLDIKLFALDLDGVLTNGKMLISSNGEWLRQMDIKDGFAIELAVRSGYIIAVISGSSSIPVKDRLNKLGVHLFFENIQSKSMVLDTIMSDLSLKKENVLFMGDDIPDLDVFDHVGLFSCPSDAVIDVREKAHFISTHNGGHGCVRQVIEKTLRVQGKWPV